MFFGNRYRIGWNPNERVLTPAILRPSSFRGSGFSRLWYTKAAEGLPGDGDGRVYGQPLVASAERIDGLARDLVIVATNLNEVWALGSSDGSVVWRTGLGEPALTDDQFGQGLSSSYCKNVSPRHGVTSTPILDETEGVVYVASVTSLARDDFRKQQYHLHKIRIADGAPLWSKPALLTARFGDPAEGGLAFDAYLHTQRAALALASFPGFGDTPPGKVVLVAFSSRCDALGQGGASWRGWLLAVDGVSGEVRGAFCAVLGRPVNGGGGIWGPGGIAIDDSSFLYAVTGNGPFDGVLDLGESVVKLALNPDGSLYGPVDSYTPSNWSALATLDLDLGGSSAVLLPALTPGGLGCTVNLLVTGGKDGWLYFVNRDALGGVGGEIAKRQIFDDSHGGGGIYVTPAYFDAGARGQFLFVTSSAHAGSYQGLVSVRIGAPDGEGPLGLKVTQFRLPDGSSRLHGPGSPFVSSRGMGDAARDAVVWVVESFLGDDESAAHDARFHAWDAVSGEYLFGDSVGDGRKFLPVAVVNGLVFIAVDGVVCYGVRSLVRE